MEVDRIGEDLVKDLENSLPSLLVAINDLFLKLEASIGHIHANRQVRYMNRCPIFYSLNYFLT